MRTNSLAALLVFSTFPSAAFASDMSGIVTVMAFTFVIGPFALLNLLAVIILSVKRRYASRQWAVNHTLIAAAGPALGILLALIDFSGSYHTTDRNISLAVLSALLLLACLPMAVHRLQAHA